jgi:hypothetical protein
MSDTYVSTDIEADGPIPGPHSMLSLGSVALLADGQELGSFSANLQTLPGAGPHPHTTTWWQSHPKAWAACRENPEPPAVVMQRYVTWLDALPGSPVFVAHPATWDFAFVYWYLIRFAGRSPFGHSGLDMKTLAMAITKLSFRACSKRNFPKAWKPKDLSHTHVALDDAREQGQIFLAMLRASGVV